MTKEYVTPEPQREYIDASQGPVLLEFGTGWCGHCQAAASAIEESLAQFPTVEHIKVEDGPGRPLGRSFRVKLWPTAIFLRDGVEVTRLVRPESADDTAGVVAKYLLAEEGVEPGEAFEETVVFECFDPSIGVARHGSHPRGSKLGRLRRAPGWF